jgi:hypothetical protein
VLLCWWWRWEDWSSQSATDSWGETAGPL